MASNLHVVFYLDLYIIILKVFLDGDNKMLGNLLGGFIVILVGVNLLPTVASQVVIAKNNLTGNQAAQALLDLVVIFYTLGVMSAAVGIAVSGLRQAGLV